MLEQTGKEWFYKEGLMSTTQRLNVNHSKIERQPLKEFRLLSFAKLEETFIIIITVKPV